MVDGVGWIGGQEAQEGGEGGERNVLRFFVCFARPSVALRGGELLLGPCGPALFSRSVHSTSGSGPSGPASPRGRGARVNWGAGPTRSRLGKVPGHSGREGRHASGNPPAPSKRAGAVGRQAKSCSWPPIRGANRMGPTPCRVCAAPTSCCFSHHPFFPSVFAPPLVALRAPRAARRGMGAWRAVMRPRARACWGSVAFLWGLGRTPPLHLLFAGPRSFPVRPSRPRNPRVTEWRPTRALHYPPFPLVPSPNSPSTSPASSSATSSSWPARARPRARRPAPARARGTP
jgi:hypothetical protein